MGYLWNLAAKWINRTIGLISTLCLVRILEPSDFGLVALATIVLAFFAIFSDAGTKQYLIKATHCSDEMLNSGWSLNIALKLGCGVVVALFAHYLAGYLKEPQLVNILLVACVIPVLNALKNVGLVLYERELNYKPLTQLSVTVKLATVPITLFFAFSLKNYWALMIGLIISEVMTVVGSYMLHPYRPRWSTQFWAQQWSFSKWHLISMTTGYVRSRIDALLLGRYLSSNEVGMYRVGQEFAWLPFSELIAPATSSMYAGLTHVRDEQAQLHQSILRYLAMAYFLVVPSAFGLYAFSDLFTNVMLGEKWKQAAPLIGMLAILMLSMPLNISLQAVLTNLSKIKYLIILDMVMISGIVTIIIGLSKAERLDIYLFTEYRMYLVALFVLMLSVTYQKLINLSVWRIFPVVIMPMLPAFITVNVLKVIQTHLVYPDMVELLVLGICGIVLFVPLMLITIIIAKQSREEYAFIFSVLKKCTPLKQ